MPDFLVRVGAMGQVGRFRPALPAVLRKGQRVVVRTRRGLETGEFLSESQSEFGDLDAVTDGEFLRAMTPEDDLLASRLERRRHEAFSSCETCLRERDIPAQLVDVETLFDGGAIVFYSSATRRPKPRPSSGELAEKFAAEIRLTDFANLLEHGCGPACGTEEGAGCGTSSATAAPPAAWHPPATPKWRQPTKASDKYIKVTSARRQGSDLIILSIL